MNIRRWITGVEPRLNGCVTNRTFPQSRRGSLQQNDSGTFPLPFFPPSYADGFHSASVSREAFCCGSMEEACFTCFSCIFYIFGFYFIHLSFPCCFLPWFTSTSSFFFFLALEVNQTLQCSGQHFTTRCPWWTHCHHIEMHLILICLLTDEIKNPTHFWRF